MLVDIHQVLQLRLSKTSSTARLCLQVWSSEWDLSLLSIDWGRLCALCGQGTSNSSLSHRRTQYRGGLSKDFQPVSAWVCPTWLVIPSKVWKICRDCEQVMLLSMTWSCLTSCVRLWKPRKSQDSFHLVRQMEHQVTKRHSRPRVSQGSMRLCENPR